ncbi:MAG: GNAT family N-acetyltransferase [Gemmatimonadetes bacterium]|nr:GNAT family N-acetyltransferase [Gemmatimonadota bacterium]
MSDRALADGDHAPVSIRAARAADLPAIGALGALLVAEHHDFDAQRFLAASAATPAGYADYLGTQLARPDVLVLVADLAGAVVGYCYAGLEPTDYMALRGPAGAVYDVVVDPAARGRGIGRQLMEATLAALRDRGAPRVVLSTAARNAAAQRLFTRLGFRPTMIEMTRESTPSEGQA